MSADRHENTQALKLEYEGKHQNKSLSEGGGILTFHVTLHQDPPPGAKRNPEAAKKEGLLPEGGFSATIYFEGCEGATPEDALKRLAEWCIRAAETINNFKPEVKIPS